MRIATALLMGAALPFAASCWAMAVPRRPSEATQTMEQTASAMTPFLIDMSFLPLFVVISALAEFTSEASCKLASPGAALKGLLHARTWRFAGKPASGFKKCSTLALFHKTVRLSPLFMEPHHGQGLSSLG